VSTTVGQCAQSVGNVQYQYAQNYDRIFYSADCEPQCEHPCSRLSPDGNPSLRDAVFILAAVCVNYRPSFVPLMFSIRSSIRSAPVPHVDSKCFTAAFIKLEQKSKAGSYWRYGLARSNHSLIQKSYFSDVVAGNSSSRLRETNRAPHYSDCRIRCGYCRSGSPEVLLQTMVEGLRVAIATPAEDMANVVASALRSTLGDIAGCKSGRRKPIQTVNTILYIRMVSENCGNVFTHSVYTAYQCQQDDKWQLLFSRFPASDSGSRDTICSTTQPCARPEVLERPVNLFASLCRAVP
jgi:hypothetical protein